MTNSDVLSLPTFMGRRFFECTGYVQAIFRTDVLLNDGSDRDDNHPMIALVFDDQSCFWDDNCHPEGHKVAATYGDYVFSGIDVADCKEKLFKFLDSTLTCGVHS